MESSFTRKRRVPLLPLRRMECFPIAYLARRTALASASDASGRIDKTPVFAKSCRTSSVLLDLSPERLVGGSHLPGDRAGHLRRYLETRAYLPVRPKTLKATGDLFRKSAAAGRKRGSGYNPKSILIEGNWFLTRLEKGWVSKDFYIQLSPLASSSILCLVCLID